MSKLTPAGLLVSLLALTLATPALAVKQHDNQVFFDVNGLTAFSFTENATNGHSITKGQPYGGTTSGIKKESGHDQAYVVVKAGRKNSSTNAAWFKTQAGTGQTLACDSSGTYPNELNFAVQGTMVFTTTTGKVITCENVIVAQGHFGLNNNWWMASPTMKGAHVSISGATEQTCKQKGSPLPVVVVFSPKTPCVNHFSIALE